LFYNHRNKADLHRLAGALERSTPLQKAQIVAWSLAVGVMRPKGILLRLTCLIARLSSPKDGGCHVLIKVFSQDRSRDATQDLWDQTIRHLIDGKDLSDPSSAGGLNREELNMLVRIAKILRINLDSNLQAN